MSPDPSAGRRILMVTPTYNELESLEPTVAKLFASAPQVDLLIVDDSSPDGTGDLAERLAAENPRIHVMHRATKDGLGRAYLAGFAWGLEQGYDVLGQMDADGSHPADALPAMIAALDRADHPGLVIGSRWMKGGSVIDWPFRRLLLSRGANFYARVALGIPIHDITAGYRLYLAPVLRGIVGADVDSKGYCFQIDLTIRTHDMGAAIAEVPIAFRERAAGYSKMSSDIVIEAMTKVTVWGFARRFSPRRRREIRASIAAGIRSDSAA